ncbi:MAG: HAMP domain-containing sensor histidine kinase [Bacteroidota bacterium]|nr:HAMP domain-containing sensor histidine kinase [Bacteroidota bacterium]
MRLNNKFTGWYLLVMLVVLLIGGAIVYYEIQWKIGSVEVARHQRLNDLIAQQIRTGGNYADHPTRKRATVTLIPEDSVPANLSSFYTRGTGWNPEYQANEYRLVVTSFYQINGRTYRISTYSFIPSFGQLLPGVVDSFKWILLLLLVLVGISGRLISKYILAPFKHTLRVIESFELKQKQTLRLPPTRTDEFRQLNSFLQRMTDKALEDYQSLKEFTENASHELQTPTAIIRGKLELLMESDIRDDQAVLIAEMQNALEKLSRIHSSLTLLTKLENYEYQDQEPICFSQSAKEALDSFEELIEMKALILTTRMEKDVFLPMPSSLADLLLNNLVSNAIRHNQPGGMINVQLSRAGLVISNTGMPPETPTDELFERFKKGNPGSDSIGIGLAIVRQICDLHGFPIVYEFRDGRHILAVSFIQSVAASKLLQNVDRSLYTEA